MDFAKFTKEQLLNKCNELEIKKCKNKNKSQIISILNEKYLKLSNNTKNTQSIDELNNFNETVGYSTSTKSVRDEGLDKFYTKPEIVDKCLDMISKCIKIEDFNLIIEPSAGNGNFLLKIQSQIKNTQVIGIDILPEHPSIIKQDYLTFYPSETESNILVIGNPPFGKVSSLAVKFFNHSAKFAETIAFIIPRTFRKTSIQNRLDCNFHLIYDEDIPVKPCSFEPCMSVKCCFQIWKKQKIKRTIVKLDTEHKDWNFLQFGPKDEKGQPTPPIGADFALKAYGGKCGEIEREGLEKLRPKSWHWIKSNIDIEILIKNFNSLDYENCKNTARQNSVGRGELVSLYNTKFG